MIGKLLKLKKNKFLFVIAIAFCAVVLFDLFAVVFNLVQILTMKNNAASFTGWMLPVNIIAISLNVAFAIFVVIYLILRKTKENVLWQS